MGMAASQARFLTLTARKTNVEWEGQQVNQQRTALANESANLFNQLSALEVPTPPSVKDYTKTVYKFSTSDLDTSSQTGETEYKIVDLYSTPAGRYARVEHTKYTWTSGITSSYAGAVSKDDEGNYNVSITGTGLTAPAKEYVFTPDSIQFEAQFGPDTKFQIGGVDFKLDDAGRNIVGEKDGKTYRYEAEDLGNGKYRIKIQTDAIKAGEQQSVIPDDVIPGGATVSYNQTTGEYTVTLNGSSTQGLDLNVAGLYTNGQSTLSPSIFEDGFFNCGQAEGTKYNQPVLSYVLNGVTYYVSAQEFANGYFNASYTIYQKAETVTEDFPCEYSTAASGRVQTITLVDDRGEQHTYDLSVESEEDEARYKEAMLDYEYNKSLYEQEVTRINAKTEKIQEEDRTLELRLKQLDTEQNALKTEMDAVSKVIEDNIEATFKTFA